jgi:hypothetical protein
MMGWEDNPNKTFIISKRGRDIQFRDSKKNLLTCYKEKERVDIA